MRLEVALRLVFGPGWRLHGGGCRLSRASGWFGEVREEEAAFSGVRPSGSPKHCSARKFATAREPPRPHPGAIALAAGILGEG